MARIIYAPFLSTKMRLKDTDRWTELGLHEENSEIGIEEIVVGPSNDERIVGVNLKIVVLDAEASNANIQRYYPFQNRRVEAAFFFGGAGMLEEKLRYRSSLKNIPKRGMQIIHTFTGKSFSPYWVTAFDISSDERSFGDDPWTNFLQYIR